MKEIERSLSEEGEEEGGEGKRVVIMQESSGAASAHKSEELVGVVGSFGDGRCS